MNLKINGQGIIFHPTSRNNLIISALIYNKLMMNYMIKQFKDQCWEKLAVRYLK